ncbi:unnamed protein product [Toxocara canis]|uniref:CCHC-type domain-containing protein n=1 Tax=Toxocara canis TaxID=6265 RepID=A0A183TY39_TOXCA|nr:unnamed protein product [Toxocara canis]
MKKQGQEEAQKRMIDSENLRAILEAQEERQHQMLKAVLEAANQQQQALLEQFIYDPDNGCTLDVWFKRYEDLTVQDGSTLAEAAKARLIVSKLDAVANARFTNNILLIRASELCYDDTVKTLKELFGHNTVQRHHPRADEVLGVDLWSPHPDDADIRTLALRKMEINPQTTLKELSLEIQQFLNIRPHAKLLGSPPSLLQPEVNAVATKKNCTQKPPSPCFRCRGSHWARECYFTDKRCNSCKLVGHKKGNRKNFSYKDKRNREKSRATKNVVVISIVIYTDCYQYS